MSVLLLQTLVSNDDRQALVDWAIDLLARGKLQRNERHPRRAYSRVNVLGTLPDAWLRLLDHLTGLLDTKEMPRCPFLGHQLSIVEQGGERDTPFIAKHEFRRRSIRANVVLCLPAAGGEWLVEGEPVVVKEGSGWVFRADSLKLSTLPVVGPKPRISLQFGWSVPADYRLPQEDEIPRPARPPSSAD